MIAKMELAESRASFESTLKIIQHLLVSVSDDENSISEMMRCDDLVSATRLLETTICSLKTKFQETSKAIVEVRFASLILSFLIQLYIFSVFSE